MDNKNILLEVKKLRHQGKTNKEISQILNLSYSKINLISYRNFGPNKNYLNKITKHNHLHEKILKYHLDHSLDEVLEHFNLIMSEYKSCMTCAYKKKEFSHLRRDKRRKDKWTSDEIRTMLRYCGILDRNRIAKLIGRGSQRVIKEKLSALGVSSRNINGVNLTQFRNLFRFDPQFQIRGVAGPGGINGGNNFVIIPWNYVYQVYKHQSHDETILKIFKIYALFQKYIWGGEPWDMMKKDNNIREFLYTVE